MLHPLLCRILASFFYEHDQSKLFPSYHPLFLCTSPLWTVTLGACPDRCQLTSPTDETSTWKQTSSMSSIPVTPPMFRTASGPPSCPAIEVDSPRSLKNPSLRRPSAFPSSMSTVDGL